MDENESSSPRNRKKIYATIHRVSSKFLKRIERPSEDEWKEIQRFIAQNPQLEQLDKKDRNLKSLIRYVGIPQELRSLIWPLLTTARRRQRLNLLAYNDILQTNAHKTNDFTKQIEKDLPRTLLIQKEEHLPILRRILVAFSWVNPNIGYCQSMNFVAAALILCLEEETAFWTLRSIIEEILPNGYYSDDLLGIKIDAKVIQKYVEEKFPQLHQHLTTLKIHFLPILSEWFLCLFVNLFPFKTSLRFLDLLLCDGNKILLRMALALLRFYEKDLLSLQTFEEAFAYLKKLPALVTDLDAERLFEMCYDRLWFGRFSYTKINAMREEIRQQIMQEKSVLQMKRLKRHNRKAIILQEDGPTIAQTFVLDPVQTFSEKITPQLENDLVNLGYFITEEKEEPYVPKSWRIVKFEKFFVIENYEPQIKTLRFPVRNNFST
jgi:hypothetical protein